MLKTLMNNYPYRFMNKNKRHYIQVRSEHLHRPYRSTSTIEMGIESNKSKRSTVFYNATIKIPFLQPLVPLPIIVKALNWDFNEFIRVSKKIFSSKWDEKRFRKYVIMFMSDNHGCDTKEHALLYISKLYGKADNINSAKHVINTEILPHLNDKKNVDYAKGRYLSYMFGLLILFREGKIEASNRDSYMFTRITDSGTSLAVLFRMQFLSFIKQGLKFMRRVLNKNKEINIDKIYNPTRISKKIQSALATGTWSSKRKGVSHPMTTTNSNCIIAQLRRISSSYLNNDGKHTTPRMVLSNSQWLYLCSRNTRK